MNLIGIASGIIGILIAASMFYTAYKTPPDETIQTRMGSNVDPETYRRIGVAILGLGLLIIALALMD